MSGTLKKMDTAASLILDTHHGEGSLHAAEHALEEEEAAAFDITRNRWFLTVVYCSVFANAIQYGIQVDHPDLPGYKAMEHGFTAIFTFEMLVKLKVLRLAYFKEGWNVLDFVLVWLSILDVWIMGIVMSGESALSKFSVLRMLRILRIVRMVRLLKVFKEMWLIVSGILSSIPTILWASMLLVSALYVSALVCVATIGKNRNVWPNRLVDTVEPGEFVDYYGSSFDSFQYFGTVSRSMCTLFETTIEPLNYRPIVERQPELIVFFLMFIGASSFGVLNVIIGVIVDNTMEASNEMEEDERALEAIANVEKVEQIRDACFAFDEDGNGVITLEEIRRGMAGGTDIEVLRLMPLPFGVTPDELFSLLDQDASGEVGNVEMLRALARTIVGEDMQHLLEVHRDLHQFQRSFRDRIDTLQIRVDAFVEGMGSRLDALAERLQARAARRLLEEAVEEAEAAGPPQAGDPTAARGHGGEPVVGGSATEAPGAAAAARPRRQRDARPPSAWKRLKEEDDSPSEARYKVQRAPASVWKLPVGVAKHNWAWSKADNSQGGAKPPLAFSPGERAPAQAGARNAPPIVTRLLTMGINGVPVPQGGDTKDRPRRIAPF